MKSVTLEKLERMQRDAQEKVMESLKTTTPVAADALEGKGQEPGTTDIWRPEDEPEDTSEAMDENWVFTGFLWDLWNLDSKRS